ncbi:MAG: dihydropteroate synthase [Bacteroidales bacterium]|nr:dihydropteroate synthase [Bacteroidales bacterium]
MSKNIIFEKKLSINCKGKIIDLTIPKVMGILNITPDSFYDGGKYLEEGHVIARIEQMVLEGADFIDIGAMSTRPGARILTSEEEWGRLKPVLEIIKNNYSKYIFSIDTFRSEIARKAVLEYGISIINDISAGNMDENMFNAISELKVPYIIMHMQGTPENMQKNPVYEHVTNEIIQFFAHKVEILKLLGVNDVIIDPGFGFGKELTHNYQLLNSLDTFKIFELPVLVGISRKSMIYKLLGNNPSESLNGTTVLNTISLLNGANILRVHDVKEAKEVVQLVQNLFDNNHEPNHIN